MAGKRAGIASWIAYLPLKILVDALIALPSWMREALFIFILERLGPLVPASRRLFDNVKSASGQVPLGDHKDFGHSVWRFWGKAIAQMIAPGPVALTWEGHPDALALLADANKRALVITAHIGPMEWLRRPQPNVHQGLGLMYRSYNNPLVEKEVQRRLLQSHAPVFNKRRAGSLGAIRYVKQGHKLLMTADQHHSRGERIQFLGAPAMASPGPIHMSASLDCPIIPARLTLARGRWTVLVNAPVYGAHEKQHHQWLQNQIESWVRREPHLWLWLHHRWRVRG